MTDTEVGSLAALLQELKDRTPFSYGALAKRLGVSPSTLHRYCRGTTVPADYAPIERFGRLCKATPAELSELHRRWASAYAQRTSAVPTATTPQDVETISQHTAPLSDRPEDAVSPGSPGRGAPTGIGQDAPRGRTRRTVVLSAFATLVAAGVPTGLHLTRDTTPEPVAAWPLDESRGAKIAKDTAGSYDGTATAVGWGEGSGGAALFDGRSSRVATAGPVLKTGEGHSYTVSAWARLGTLDTAMEFVTVVSQSAGDLTAFFLQYWAKPNRWAFSGPKDEFRVLSSVKAVPHRWTHLVGVCDTGMLTLFIDGKQVGTGSVNVAAPESETDQLIIGGAGLARTYGDTYKDFFPGSIKNVQVFDQVLTPDEIKALG
ncbi:LamG-like jellyroll fold domain-containing protein [Streptomyces sp. CA-250714]|uniref:LamG-like jellyroll fold domain-containing protein n=1 Tax=Streptomyces sp. CA-250714 TaxID=3240060 RepID=UPI003D8CF983